MLGDDKLILAYEAGLFDGEGSVFIQQPRPGYWYLRAAMQMTFFPPIERLHARYGGSVRYDDRMNRKEGHKPVWCWSIGGTKAGEFLVAIRPFSLVKAKEIDIALEYLGQRPVGRGTQDASQAAIASAYQKRIHDLRKDDGLSTATSTPLTTS